MKKFVLVLLLFILPINCFAFSIKSKHAILYNLNDNTVLYELKSSDRVSIASMTKIMTALIVIENVKNLDDEFIMTNEMFINLKEENASVAGFKPGERVTYYDLLYGLMLPSGADAAQGLAIMTSGSIDKFVEKMNNKVKNLGLKNTHFSNPTGLDDKNNYSTVADIASILQYAVKNNNFKKVFTTDRYITSNKKHTFLATRIKNNIDTSFIDGSKTGFTYDAGLCMASISHYNGVNYLLVTAKAPYDNRINHIIDAKTIYNYYFENYEEKTILKNNDKLLTITLPDGREVEYLSGDDIKKYLKKDCHITQKYIGKNTILKSDQINDKIGEYIIKCDDKIIYSKDILLIQQLSSENKKNYKIYLLVIIFILLFIKILTNFFRKAIKK